jgi:arginine-tRNA-protein transferase
MESLFRYVASPSPCGYLPDQLWSLEFEYVGAMTPEEYLGRILEGWRRFGTMLFRPACQACSACRSLRVRAADFRPDRSQRRVRKANEGVVTLRIGKPGVTRAKLALYDRYHAYQADSKGWPQHPAKDASSYVDSFVHHPFPVEEWCYYLGDRLVGVGYVDHLPLRGEIRNPKLEIRNQSATDHPVSDFGCRASDFPAQREGGLSAIYFFYDPHERHRSLGTWNVLCLIDEAVRRRLPHVYLGYYVEGCPSMSYKPRFAPNQVRGADGVWRDFRS